MKTLAAPAKRLIPTLYTAAGSGCEGHEFFEASSICKHEGKYYFVYSSILSHELCWAVSDRPDSGYRCGGTLVSIGDIGLKGRAAADSLNMLGNTHGGVENINGQWYVFYHRQANRTNYSRQACAERRATGGRALPDASRRTACTRWKWSTAATAPSIFWKWN